MLHYYGPSGWEMVDLTVGSSSAWHLGAMLILDHSESKPQKKL